MKKLAQAPCEILREERRAAVENLLPKGGHPSLNQTLVLRSVSVADSAEASAGLHSLSLRVGGTEFT